MYSKMIKLSSKVKHKKDSKTKELKNRFSILPVTKKATGSVSPEKGFFLHKNNKHGKRHLD